MKKKYYSLLTVAILLAFSNPVFADETSQTEPSTVSSSEIVVSAPAETQPALAEVVEDPGVVNVAETPQTAPVVDLPPTVNNAPMIVQQPPSEGSNLTVSNNSASAPPVSVKGSVKAAADTNAKKSNNQQKASHNATPAEATKSEPGQTINTEQKPLEGSHTPETSAETWSALSESNYGVSEREESISGVNEVESHELESIRDSQLQNGTLSHLSNRVTPEVRPLAYARPSNLPQNFSNVEIHESSFVPSSKIMPSEMPSSLKTFFTIFMFILIFGLFNMWKGKKVIEDVFEEFPEAFSTNIENDEEIQNLVKKAQRYSNSVSESPIMEMKVGDQTIYFGKPVSNEETRAIWSIV